MRVYIALMNYIDAADAPELRDGSIKLHGPEGFAGMRKAGQLAARCLDMLAPMVKPGVTTAELDKAAMDYILDHGGIPACLGYRGYQHTVCTSVNHVVCHGIPNWHGDTSRMYPVGDVNRRAERLTKITYDALMLGIAVVKPGATTGDIGHAIQTHAEGERCSIVTDFCGHGLGKLFHDSPNILHYGRPGEGETLREGMFFTIEPMINLGRPDVKILSDGWTAVTRDRKLTAQFEHSIGVTKDGCEIFTTSPTSLHYPPYS